MGQCVINRRNTKSTWALSWSEVAGWILHCVGVSRARSPEVPRPSNASVRARRRLMAVCAVLLCAPVVVGQTIIYVDDDATGADDGTSWVDAYTNLQTAIATAQSVTPSEVRIAEGTYVPNSASEFFMMHNDVALLGGFAGAYQPGPGPPDPDDRDIDVYVTILSGDLNGDDGPGLFEDYIDNATTVVRFATQFQNATSILDGVTVRGGANNSSAIVLFAGVVRCCLITENFNSSEGGGMTLFGEGLVKDCDFVNNESAIHGGAIRLSTSGQRPTIDGCTFTGNAAVSGGAVYSRYFDLPTADQCRRPKLLLPRQHRHVYRRGVPSRRRYPVGPRVMHVQEQRGGSERRCRQYSGCVAGHNGLRVRG